MAWTHKQRMMATIRGEMPDRIPYAPRLDLWFAANRKRGTLPRPFADFEHYDRVSRAEGWGIVRVVLDYQGFGEEAILDRALEMGEGDPALASLRAIQAGVLDIPWAPNRFVAGRVIPVRDGDGAVRYLDPAGLPFGREILEYNREKIREREQKAGKKVDYEEAVFDITEISKMLEEEPEGEERRETP